VKNFVTLLTNLTLNSSELCLKIQFLLKVNTHCQYKKDRPIIAVGEIKVLFCERHAYETFKCSL
jgi:hypothetical protein